jgi:hypothetical protein
VGVAAVVEAGAAAGAGISLASAKPWIIEAVEAPKMS